VAKNKKHRENIKAWKKKQEEEFLASLPFKEQIFHDLFDYLDIQLVSRPCEHDFKLTQEFLKKRRIRFKKHIEFFIGHGGGCDCEVLYNMEDLFPKEEEPIVKKKQEPRKKLDKLELADLTIENIPSPWKLYHSGKNFEFQFGKKNAIILKIVDSLNNLDWSNKNYWKKQWEKLVELKMKSDYEVIYEEWNRFNFVTVKTQDWIPVLIWIKTAKEKSWGLLFRTELSRLRGDMNELKKLLRIIK
jgi:hypothetical protein